MTLSSRSFYNNIIFIFKTAVPSPILEIRSTPLHSEKPFDQLRILFFLDTRTIFLNLFLQVKKSSLRGVIRRWNFTT